MSDLNDPRVFSCRTHADGVESHITPMAFGFVR